MPKAVVVFPGSGLPHQSQRLALLQGQIDSIYRTESRLFRYVVYVQIINFQ